MACSAPDDDGRLSNEGRLSPVRDKDRSDAVRCTGGGNTACSDSDSVAGFVVAAAATAVGAAVETAFSSALDTAENVFERARVGTLDTDAVCVCRLRDDDLVSFVRCRNCYWGNESMRGGQCQNTTAKRQQTRTIRYCVIDGLQPMNITNEQQREVHNTTRTNCDQLQKYKTS